MWTISISGSSDLDPRVEQDRINALFPAIVGRLRANGLQADAGRGHGPHGGINVSDVEDQDAPPFPEEKAATKADAKAKKAAADEQRKAEKQTRAEESRPKVKPPTTKEEVEADKTEGSSPDTPESAKAHRVGGAKG